MSDKDGPEVQRRRHTAFRQEVADERWPHGLAGRQAAREREAADRPPVSGADVERQLQVLERKIREGLPSGTKPPLPGPKG